MTPLERFQSLIDKSAGPNGCWPWMGSGVVDGRGYGRCVWKGLTSRYAHRVALEQSLGRPLRPGMVACHRCDNPPCCNPAHLFEGTRADNQRDMAAKGRSTRGVRNPSARLSDEAIREIRASVGSVMQRELADRFGVSPSLISLIKSGHRWAA